MSDPGKQYCRSCRYQQQPFTDRYCHTCMAKIKKAVGGAKRGHHGNKQRYTDGVIQPWMDK